MPRIDPLQLLKILSVLLTPNGGIKSKEEVSRLASLMTKFSKKLVSKCIYVSILKATEPDLLVLWMSEGGWGLIHNWLSDGVQAQNWPLVSELVELLLLCPVDIERLKTNRLPKLIKTLSKNLEATEGVRQIAAEIVKKWLMVVNEVLTKQKEEASEDTEMECQQTVAEDDAEQISTIEEHNEDKVDVSDSQLPVYRIIIRDGKEVLTEVLNKDRTKGLGSGLDIIESTSSDNLSDTKGDKKIVPPEKSVKQNLKVKKVVELNVARKIPKSDRLSDASEASTSSSSGEKHDQDKIVNRSKSDPAKDRRKDKMRQIRKDPDGDIFFETKSSETKLNDKVKSKKFSKEDVGKGKGSEKVKSGSKSGNSSSTNSSGNDSGTSAGTNKVQLPSISPDLSKLGKIPKKVKTEKNEKKDSSDKKDKSNSSDKKDGTKTVVKNEKEESKTNQTVKKSSEVKKLPAPPPPKPERDSKKYNISVEARKVAPGESRPKTVKTFNSKFRSTGLEEELPPPPQPKVAKKNLSTTVTTTLITTTTTTTTSPIVSDKKPIKRISPPKESQPPEKKLKSEIIANADVVKNVTSPAQSPEKDTAGVKPSPVSKPKLQILQESDSFMDAINAANTLKEPRKRKRRMSGSKDSDKKDQSEPGSPDSSPPALVKPNFKFYQDTLENDDTAKSAASDDDKKKIKIEKDNENSVDEGCDSNSENRSPSPVEETVVNTEEEIKNEKNRLSSEGLRGVLIFAKLRKGPKKKVSWKEELEDIKHFVLDETERVNVTKTFLDMKQMERIHERENFAIARKLTNEDIMEEKIRWKVLIPCDAPALPVIPGKNSAEKDIQYAREKTVAPAIYFNKRLIPDSPAEPDLEIHATTDPTIIPLDDISGNDDSINDFTSTPWPEPKTSSPPQQETMIVVPPGGPIMGGPSGPIPNFVPSGPGFSPNSGPPSLLGPVPGPGPGPNMGFPGFSGPPGPFGPPQPGPPPGMGMMPPPGDWRGSNQDMKGPPGGPGLGSMPPDMFGPGPGMMPPPGLLPPPDIPFGMPPGPMPGPPDDMNFPGGPFNMNQGPPNGPPGPSNMFQGPPFQGGNNNQGNNNNNNWFRSNGPGGHQNRHDDDRGGNSGNRGSGGGGGYRNKRDRGRNEGRGSGGGSWRSGRGGGGDGNWGGGGGSKGGICNAYAKWGHCRSNNCPYRHPK